ncbi:MAG: bifunctional hexulose-6-phosphate synthase/ribonuclease regulator [Paenibacillus sp.]|jgi:3-hexulose-6-phosphate synthase|nr:bifunctional hexulose-6-phosphate synthase/ribonuclease regulator [Paenibacillus sp.]
MNIQLALDRLTIEQAIRVAAPIASYIDWMEVGTSLIKEFGMESVKALKHAYPDHIIVADVKTFDNAIYEFEMCYAAGADMATVMGVAPLVTIEACMNFAERRGKKVMIDLLHTTETQVKQLTAYSDAIFCLHVSKDQQEIHGSSQEGSGGLVPSSLLEGKGYMLAFAGGITVDSLPNLMSFQPHAIVIGSAITKAENPILAAKAFYELKKGGTCYE